MADITKKFEDFKKKKDNKFSKENEFEPMSNDIVALGKLKQMLRGTLWL